MARRRLTRETYTVGWVCALDTELAAAQEMLDEEHEDHECDEHDDNLYSLGSIAGHNVVIMCLPAGRIGYNPAAAVASQMRAAFKGIRFGLMVGIGGGVPSEEVDIRLGDIVVGQPYKTYGGVVQYDSGKAAPSGFERTGHLNAPPTILLSAIQRVRANAARGRSTLPENFAALEKILKFTRPNAGTDVLYKATYNHSGGGTCRSCRLDQEVDREERVGEDVVVHYGTIASGNQVMRYGVERDRISSDLGGVMCFEMEAAGLMNSFPCLVIRGICDYADSHKNKSWQPYAAAVAAAYAKEVLLVIPVAEVTKISTANKVLTREG
jgi:nucleoside phosphorylase